MIAATITVRTESSLPPEQSSSQYFYTCESRLTLCKSYHPACVSAVVKPLSGKLKVILNLSSERTVPHLLADLVLQDTMVQLSRQQYLSLVHTADSFSRMRVNRCVTQPWEEKCTTGNGCICWRVLDLLYLDN